jgi:hypothetical protein
MYPRSAQKSDGRSSVNVIVPMRLPCPTPRSTPVWCRESHARRDGVIRRGDSRCCPARRSHRWHDTILADNHAINDQGPASIAVGEDDGACAALHVGRIDADDRTANVFSTAERLGEDDPRCRQERSAEQRSCLCLMARQMAMEYAHTANGKCLMLISSNT